MRIMMFEKWLKYFSLKESLKDDRLNHILDKMADISTLTPNEEEFLKKYDTIKEEDLKDYTHLSPHTTFEKIRKILDNNNHIICDLYDKEGIIGSPIISIEINYDSGDYTLNLENGQSHVLKDNFLYNIIYDYKNDNYSLQSQDEYYEKMPIKNE